MPCNSDYLAPTSKERRLKQTSVNLRWLLGKLNSDVPEQVLIDSNDIYCRDHGQVEKLCDLIKSMTGNQVEAIIYNARDKQARAVADWWEEHQEADRERLAKEYKEKDRQRLQRKKAINDMTWKMDEW